MKQLFIHPHHRRTLNRNIPKQKLYIIEQAPNFEKKMYLKILLLFLAVTCHSSSSYFLGELQYQLVAIKLSDLYLNQTVASSFEILKQEWKTFKETYDKTYNSTEEDLKRMQIFAESKLYVAQHNDLFEKGVVTYSVKLNEFSDLTTDEFNEIYGMKTENIDFDEEDKDFEDSSFLPLESLVIPDEKDWRKDGAVTRVRNQGECGSCWAFSAVGALEGQYFRTRHRLVEMSEQNLMDCSHENNGCNGGLPKKAFLYTKNGGIDTEKSYPYEGRNDKCRYKRKYAVKGITGYKTIGDEEKLKIYVGVLGPVSVLVDTHGKGFHDYGKGVYFNATCSPKRQDLNHAVLVVGYGVEDGVDYWLVKNSWGEGWGEKGYIKMARNRNNHCGIVTEAAIPTFSKKR